MLIETVNYRQKGAFDSVSLSRHRGFNGEGHELFVSSVAEAEAEVQERLASIRQDTPHFPKAVIGPNLGHGPYQLLDDHGDWKQQFTFQCPAAARLFLRTLRASGSQTEV